MSHHESLFEMDRRIKELEHALTANDEYLQKVEAENTELRNRIDALQKALNAITHQCTLMTNAARSAIVESLKPLK